MTNAGQRTTPPLDLAMTQRRMLLWLAVMIVLSITTSLIGLVIGGGSPDPEAASSIARPTAAVITNLAQTVATIACMIAGYRLIREIGWSRANQIIFFVFCILDLVPRLISLENMSSFKTNPLGGIGCGMLVFIAIFLINRDANRILRANEVKIGLLGPCRGEIERLRGIQDA